MRLCPYCEGETSETAQKCRHCGEWVEAKPERAQETPPPPPPQPDPHPSRLSRLAVTALILALLSLLVWPIAFLPALLVIVFGHVARRKIKNSERRLRGSRVALVALILAYLTLVGSIWGIATSDAFEEGRQKVIAETEAETELDDVVTSALEERGF